MGLFDNLAGALGQGAGSAIVDLIKTQDLGQLVSQFDGAGLGDLAKSWISKGENLPISAAQIQSVLGSGPVGDLAAKLGVDPAQAAEQLAGLLPQVIDQLTPNGQLPGGGLGGLLGGLKL